MWNINLYLRIILLVRYFRLYNMCLIICGLGLVGYDDCFTRSRSRVRFSEPVYGELGLVGYDDCLTRNRSRVQFSELV